MGSIPGTPANMIASETTRTRDTWIALRASLLAFVRARVSDDATAEDIVQDVLVRGLPGAEAIAATDRLQAWFYRIARNAVVDHYRTRRATTRLPEDLVEETAEPAVLEELAACMRPFIAQLPEDYRQAIVLSELRGLTLRETGERLGLSLSGAKSRVQRGRARLRDLMQECCVFERDSRGNVMDRKALHPSGCVCGCSAG